MSLKKIAICFYGSVGSLDGKVGRGCPLDPAIAGQRNLSNLIEPNNADIFIHSWSTRSQDQLNQLYSPKLALIEEQKDFPEAEIFLKNRTHLERAKDFLKLRSFSKEYRERMLESIERARSRWYSTREVIRLKTVYETLNGFNYDIVFLTRLDVGFYTRVDLDKYDPKCFYASNWNGCPTAKTGMPFDKNNYNLGQGLLDFWFFSNTEAMSRFGELFDSMSRYHINPHVAALQHAKFLNFDIRYTLYRGLDHELVRRMEFGSVK